MEDVKLGLKENFNQFFLLVIINGFVGGMVGLERTILPQIAEHEFNINVKTSILSFIVVFGISKAVTNYFTGALSNKTGRKNLLILGWLFGLPVPVILMTANSWNQIMAANVLLGINQGLAWSSTVIMKIDLAGEKQRGFAMGINEFAGYLSVAVIAFFTGMIADKYSLRPYPFYIGIVLAIAGLLLSLLFVKDTRHHVKKETQTNIQKRLKNIFWETTWKNKNLGSVTQAGLINNFNDGVVWGLFPLLLASKQLSLKQIGIVVSIYPGIWGIGQLFTGKMGDVFSKKTLLVTGMLLQAAALLFFPFVSSLTGFIILSALLGLGTAVVYPVFLAAIADYTNPLDRAQSIGVFRLWRDLGYAIGALITGIIADRTNIHTAIVFTGLITMLSAAILQTRMEKQGEL
ncbi:MAG: MFS transporter [Bacteroidetes bacterium]|nr:MAG: MFS transporter [Bacteroidota bacterium]